MLVAAVLAGSFALSSPADATLFSCPIGQGTYRAGTWWGCAAIAYIGGFEGSVADLSAPSPGCVWVERRISTSPVAWESIAVDCTANNEAVYISRPGLGWAPLRLRSGSNIFALPNP
jgi:hypothetical protein